MYMRVAPPKIKSAPPSFNMKTMVDAI